MNVEGTRNVAIACAEVRAKLIHVSTDYVFDGENGYHKEEDKPNPISYYGLTKLEGEMRIIALCKNHAILRASVIYGVRATRY